MNKGIERAVAEIYAGLGDPRAALAGRCADDVEARDSQFLQDLIDQVVELTMDLPEPSQRQKHGEECYRTHPACLALFINQILTE